MWPWPGGGTAGLGPGDRDGPVAAFWERCVSDRCVAEIMDKYYDPNTGLFFELAASDFGDKGGGRLRARDVPWDIWFTRQQPFESAARTIDGSF